LGVLSLEGNLIVLEQGGYVLGITHGLGFSYIHEEEPGFRDSENEFTALDATGGLFFQVPVGRYSAFLGLKYTCGMAWTSSPDMSFNSHFFTGSMGLVLNVSRLRVILEVVGGYGTGDIRAIFLEEMSSSVAWMIMPTVGFSVAY
jgi:hypothetical protein